MVRRIFGKKVKYKFCKLEPGVSGEFDPQTLTIKISNSLKGEDKVGTILHEQLHFLFHALGFDNVIEDGIEELLISNVENFIIENYKLVPKRKLKLRG